MTDELIIYKEDLEYYQESCKKVNVLINAVEEHQKDTLKIKIDYDYAYQLIYIGSEIVLLKRKKRLQNETL